jgi:hypothetical protein
VNRQNARVGLLRMGGRREHDETNKCGECDASHEKFPLIVGVDVFRRCDRTKPGLSLQEIEAWYRPRA